MTLDRDRAALRPAVLSAGAIVALYLGTLYLCRDGVVADGYDGVGFVLSVDAFDLARFQPHPPGYPLFVLAGRLLHAVGLRPALGLAATSALLLGVGLGALAGVIFAAAGRRAGLLFLLLVPPAPLVFGLGVATLSDGAGLGMLLGAASLALALLSRPSAPPALHGLVGVAAGLALGLRPPLLPLLALVLAVIYAGIGTRRPSAPSSVMPWLLGGLGVTVLAWLVPLCFIVGPMRLLMLTLRHGRGHFSDFGGSAVSETRPLARLYAFATGLLDGGLGRLGALLLVPLLPGLGRLRLRGWRLRPVARILPFVAAYALWVLLTVPVGANGRHLLPLAVALGTLGALVLATLDGGLGYLSVGLAALVAIANGQSAWSFRRTLPPGAELARFVITKRTERRLYGARAARYLDLGLGVGSAQPAAYLGEVLGDLERQSHLPTEVLVTSEVVASPTSQPLLRRLERFCYPSTVPQVLRFDRAPAPAGQAGFQGDCVDLLAYRLRP